MNSIRVHREQYHCSLPMGVYSSSLVFACTETGKTGFKSKIKPGYLIQCAAKLQVTVCLLKYDSVLIYHLAFLLFLMITS